MSEELEGEGIGRLAYLRLLIQGHAALGSEAPEGLRLELEQLVKEEAAAEKLRLEAKFAEEKAQMEEWERQRGRRFARAAGWWSKNDAPPWEAVEVPETEEERLAARRKLWEEIRDEKNAVENLRRARKVQGLRGKPGEWTQPPEPIVFPPLYEEEPF